RTGNPSRFVEPRTAFDPNIKQAVVIIVGLLDVQTAGQTQKAGSGGVFGEMPITIVVEIVKLATQVPGRNHYINESVIIEIIEDAAAGKALQIQAQGSRDIRITRQVVSGIKNFRGNEPLRGHLLRIFTQSHIGNVD